jgi:ER lumen protein retaining receptor
MPRPNSQIWKTRSCAGISGKAQILFLVVFVTRYLDLVTNFISVYNTTMKVFFVGSSAATVYLMYVKFKATYDGNHDTFRCGVNCNPFYVSRTFSSGYEANCPWRVTNRFSMLIRI